MATGDRARELPPAGATVAAARTTVFDVKTPDASGTVLNVPETARRWGVSRKTVMRRLAEGAVPGAYKRPGPKGEEWALPVACLEAVFGPDRTQRAGGQGAATPDSTAVTAGSDTGQELSQALNVLVNVMDELRQQLGQERERSWLVLQAGETERVQRAELEYELRGAIERAARAEALLSRRQRRRLGLG